MSNQHPHCARCPFPPPKRSCRTASGKHPSDCPTENRENLADEVLSRYHEEPVARFAREASLQEAAGYSCRELGYDHLRPAKPRLEEIFDFIDRMDYKRVGMAFCIGLQREAAMVEKLFRQRGLDLVSAVCKVGRTEKEKIGLEDDDKIAPGSYEPMCNPILQAALLNEAETEFNVLLGLCVGHDSLFLQHASAPCTILAVKDRVTGHNPLAAVYTIDSYYRSLKREERSTGQDD